MDLANVKVCSWDVQITQEEHDTTPVIHRVAFLKRAVFPPRGATWEPHWLLHCPACWERWTVPIPKLPHFFVQQAKQRLEINRLIALREMGKGNGT